jgi:tyrosyl-tRNA synthetase
MTEKEQKIEELLSRNVGEVVDKNHLRDALKSGKKLRVKLGIDPTSPDLHLGHAVVLSKLREFQDLGCTAVLLIGDFTAQIGDPSGRDKTRPPLIQSDVKENMKHYLKQAGKVLDIKKTEVVYNSSWLGKLTTVDMLKLLSKVSVQQVIEREDFDRRLSEGKSVQMHELIYPVLVAYDSVAMKADVEMGGDDQFFNFLMGRAVMEKFDMQPQDILTTRLLVGTDGERKMSKSLGNYIGLNDEPSDMFGKVMSVRDDLIQKYFELATTMSADEIADIAKEFKNGTNPKTLKERLAFEIVKRYHGETAAQKAQENFEKVFSRHETPDDLPVLKLKAKNMTALDMVVASGIMKSRSEARRLIEQGGFEFDEKIIKNPLEEVVIHGGEVMRVGKKSFFKIS